MNKITSRLLKYSHTKILNTPYSIPHTPYPILLLLILTPFNLFYKLTLKNAYVNGLLVDYLIPKIYISDIFIIVFILICLASWIKNRIKRIKSKTLNTPYPILNTKIPNTKYSILILILILILNTNTWYFLKLLELGIFTWIIFKNKTQLLKNSIPHTQYPILKHQIPHTKYPILNTKTLTYSILASLLFQSLLGLYQFTTQHSLFDYHILGETNLLNFTNVTKASFSWAGGEERILPYGTTAHPNILGGFLTIFWLTAINLVSKIKTKTQILNTDTKYLSKILWAITPFVLTTIYLTQSISAWLALGLGMIFIFYPKFIKQNRKKLLFSIIIALIISPFVISYFSHQNPKNLSLNRRNTLNQAAWNMFTKNPLSGVGLNNFTTQVEKYSPDKEIVRFVQPAHHVGLLWLAETGMVGGALILFWIWLGWKKLNSKTQKNEIIFLLIIFLPIAILDHYLLTQQTGLLMIVFAAYLINLPISTIIRY